MVALDKKALWKDIERDLRKKQRETIDRLRSEWKAARLNKKTALAAVRAQCQADRASVRAKAAELRSQLRAEYKDRASRLRSEARASCASGAQAVKDDVAKKADAVKAERAAQKEQRAIERLARASKKKAPRTSARERRSESDDEVRQNISPELVPLFERVKRQIKGSARMTRTEAFLHYVEEHPGEAMAAIEEKTEAVIRELARKEARRPLARTSYVPPAASSDAEDTWGGLLNPGASLVALGKLTALEFEARGRRRVFRWGLRSAPILAYDDAGRLHVVFASHVIGKASKEGASEYARTHWGQKGRGAELDGKCLAGPFRGAERLGRSTRITYTTRKGSDPEPTDYVHEWGDGAKGGRFVAPVVVAQRGMIALSGGTYRVTSRGIVG